jgi:hypothetical protein
LDLGALDGAVGRLGEQVAAAAAAMPDHATFLSQRQASI